MLSTPLHRRPLLTGGLALGLAAIAGRAPAATVRKAPRRDVLSINFRTGDMHPVVVTQPSTWVLIVTLESQVEALRIGLANTTPTPYRLDGIALRETADRGHNQPWHFVSFGQTRGGAIAPAAPAPHPCIVPGNGPNPQTGATNVPALIWSDWMEFHTAPAQRPRLEFRVVVPPQTLPMALAAGPGDTDQFVPSHGHRLFVQHVTDGSHLTDDVPAEAWRAERNAPLYVVQYRTAVPGVQIVIGGDSHMGSSLTFADLSSYRLSTPTNPISVWNAARGAQPIATFWPTLDEAIDAAHPSISVIQGWTAGTGMRLDRDQAYLTQVRESAERTLREGGVPIIVKGMPRHIADNPTALASWRTINRELGTLMPDVLVFDPDPYVDDPAHPGDWRAGDSADGIHPNLQGNLAMEAGFDTILAKIL